MTGAAESCMITEKQTNRISAAERRSHMEKAFPILMLCFAGLLLVYAGILALTKDVMLIPHADKAKIPDPKAYALRFAGIMALVTIGPLASGIAGLIYDNKRAAIALIVGLVFSLWGATQLVKKVM